MAKNQTMTKAAQQLHISQPALSIGLKKLEED
ncbi:MAG: LysR family transcriptional regulator [Thomasclavelia ramosa]|nr:LysR family transcriptional regulator [Thomasclavelia ramosa]